VHRRRAADGAARLALLAAALAVALAAVAPCARADEPDPWFGRDKALHFAFSAAIAGGGYGATAVVTDDRRWRFLVGAGLAVTAGVGKEVVDLYGPGDASWRDLTWDLVGTATGLGVAFVLDWTIHRLASPAR
jgi:putative lipoprotein